MLGDFLNNVSTLLNIDNAIIPNIITFMVVTVIVFVSLKSQLSWVTLGSIYAIAMGVLSILGVDSVFKIITLVENYVIGSLFGGVVY